MYCVTKNEKFEHNCYQMNIKLKYKKLFKIWTQRKGEHKDIKGECFQNGNIGCKRTFVCN
jgi:hypothetical protein